MKMISMHYLSIILIILSAFTLSPSFGLASNENIDWLLGQQNPSTALLDSYQNDNNAWGMDNPDGSQGYLYDQSLAVIAFTSNREYDNADSILEGLIQLQQRDDSWYDGFWTDVPLANPIGDIITHWRKFVGANAWMVLAILHYTVATDDESYIPLAERCANWLIQRQINDISNPNYGALKGGIENGQEVTWISTEMNCVAYAALKHLGIYLDNIYYQEKANLIKNWIFTVAWNNSELRFNEGDSITSRVLDPQTFTYLAFIKGATDEERDKLDQAINWIINSLIENIVYQNQDFSGPRFGENISWNPRIDVPHIWWEGTGQLTTVFHVQRDNTNKNFYLNQLTSTENGGGIPYSFTDQNTPTNPQWPYYIPYNSVAATTWYYLSYTGINPFVVNFNPTIEEIGNFAINEGELLEFNVTATDPNGDLVTLSVENLPSGATFDANLGTFSWTPGFLQAGIYNITFVATDEHGASDSETISVTVVNRIISPPRVTLRLTPYQRSYSVGDTVTLEIQVASEIGLDRIVINAYGFNPSVMPRSRIINLQENQIYTEEQQLVLQEEGSHRILVYAYDTLYSVIPRAEERHYSIGWKWFTVFPGTPVTYAQPTVSISTDKSSYRVGENIRVTISAHADAGLSMVWGWGDSNFRRFASRWFFYVTNCSGRNDCSQTFTVSVREPGMYRIYARSRDRVYPIPGEQHQSDVSSVQITVAE